MSLIYQILEDLAELTEIENAVLLCIAPLFGLFTAFVPRLFKSKE